MNKNYKRLLKHKFIEEFVSDSREDDWVRPMGSVIRPSSVLSWLEENIDTSILRAHQSGIEEGARAERVKIAKLLGDEYENMENNASFYLKLAESLKENKQ